MPAKSTLAQAQALGLATPQPNDQIHRGDDAITENARYTADALADAAAAAAATTALAASEKVLHPLSADPAALNPAVFGITDKAGRAALEVRADGTVEVHRPGGNLMAADDPRVLTENASLWTFAITDDAGRTALYVTEDGTVHIPRLEATTEAPAAGLAFWGDSLSDDTSASGWGRSTAEALGLPWYNGGWWGQSSAQIAARQGGDPVTTTAAVTIPATTTAVTVALTANPVTASRVGSIPVLLAGVPGTLTYDGTTLTFTRTTAGTEVPVRTGSKVTPTEGAARREWIQTIWMGRNGGLTEVPALVDRLKRMAAYLPHVRFLVLEVPPFSQYEPGATWTPEAEPLGSAKRAELDAMNYELREAFPEHWVPIAAWLRTDAAAAAAGITFTATDRADIAAGQTPKSFRTDVTHLSAAGKRAVAAKITAEITERGWA